MNKLCITEADLKSIYVNLTGNAYDLSLIIFAAMNEKREVSSVIVGAVAIWANENPDNLKELQQLLEKIPLEKSKQ